MITEKQILEAEGGELSKLLGEVLQAKTRHTYNKFGMCMACEQWKVDKPLPCSRYIPLDDWNVAMKWRNWAVENYGMENFADCLLIANKAYISWDFVVATAKRKHYLQAAALCKIRSKK